MNQRGPKYNFAVAAQMLINPDYQVPPLLPSDLEFSLTSRRKGARRGGQGNEVNNNPSAKSPLPTVPLDVGKKLQSALDHVDRLKAEVQTLKAQKAEAQKQSSRPNTPR